MTRPIKFRAWDNKRGGWKSPQNIAIGGDGQPYWLFGYSSEVVLREDWTIMQFTGLTDRNGKEIYEDDICQTFGGFKTVVKFGIGLGSHANQMAVGFYLENDERHYDFPSESGGIEVLGNVHENKELLK